MQTKVTLTGTIGLLAAMPQESTALLHHIREARRNIVNQIPVHNFTIEDQPYVLVTSGMGMRRASEAARLLVEGYSPRLIISFGIAGAVQTDLEIGDVVLVQASCQLNNGIPGKLVPLARWSEPARDAVTEILAGRGKRVWLGVAITTGASQVEEGQLQGFHHPILEMETAGIAPIANERGIPLLSLRAIGDGPRAPIPVDLSQVMDEDANLKVGQLFRAVVRNPKVILQSRQVLRNTSLAAGGAALALMAILEMGIACLSE